MRGLGHLDVHLENFLILGCRILASKGAVGKWENITSEHHARKQKGENMKHSESFYYPERAP